MSSNIQIQRICMFCGNEFTARTTVTKCCSDTCAKKAYKAKIKAFKIDASDKQTVLIKNLPTQELKEISSKDFLSINEACQLLSISRWTLWRLIKKGDLVCAKLGRSTRIKRSDIEELFKQPEEILETKVGHEQEQPNVSECYSISEAQNMFSVSETTLYNLINRNNIEKYKEGKFVYVSKTEIQKYLGIPKSLFE